jgi:hypothetical protein
MIDQISISTSYAIGRGSDHDAALNVLARYTDTEITRFTPYREVRRLLLARSPAQLSVKGHELQAKAYQPCADQSSCTGVHRFIGTDRTFNPDSSPTGVSELPPIRSYFRGLDCQQTSTRSVCAWGRCAGRLPQSSRACVKTTNGATLVFFLNQESYT